MTFIVGTPHTHNAGHYQNRDVNGRLREDDVKTCPHCQAVLLMREWREEGAWCGCCQAPVCGGKTGNPVCSAKTEKYGCIPFVKQLEQALDLDHKLEQYIRIAGLEPAPPPQPIFTG